MQLTAEQHKEIRNKLGQYFLDYSIRHAKNVVNRYVLLNGAPTIGKANETPNVDELMGIITNE